LAVNELAARYAGVLRAGGELSPPACYQDNDGKYVPLTIHDLAKVQVGKGDGAETVGVHVLDVTDDGSEESLAKLRGLHDEVFRHSEEELEQAERELGLEPPKERKWSSGRWEFRRPAGVPPAASGTVRVIDPDTGKTVTIPASELAPGMLRVQEVGGEGEVDPVRVCIGAQCGAARVPGHC
jgi:hypothetical protein